MKEREKYENGLLSLRFVGEKFDQQGVSIYDFGTTLLAVQRIVHKAYLSKNERLKKGAFPNASERPSLALQIGERRRTSDAFALVPILLDPAVHDQLKELVKYVISGVVGYYTGDVLDRIHKEKDDNKKIFIGSIYTEVANIVNRVDTSGGVEGISLGSPVLKQETVAAFTKDTKDYLAELKNQTFLGTFQEFTGKVYRMYPNSNIVTVRRSGGSSVNVFLAEDDFESIRYRRERSPAVTFKGHPVYKLGIETNSLSDFDANEIEFPSDDS